MFAHGLGFSLATRYRDPRTLGSLSMAVARIQLKTRLDTVNNRKGGTTSTSDVTNLLDKVVELLLGIGESLVHLLVLGLPLVAVLLEGLYFAFVVARLDVGLAEPGPRQL